MTLWDDSDTRYKDVYFDWLKGYGINSIMLDFGWNKLEPTKGVYDQNYLAKMDRFVQKAKARGIYVTLRMHKWSYPDAYQAQEPTNVWLLGYPAWLNNTPDFWENVGNCWDNYVAMWTMLATHYRNEPYVAAFDLFGEPGNDVGPGIYDPPGVETGNWASNTSRKVMGVLFDNNRLYERTINAIHSVADKPAIIEAAFGLDFTYAKNPGDTEQAVARRPDSGNFAIGQSVYGSYQFGWLDGNKAIADSWNVPFVATEFGVQVAVIKSPDPAKVAWVQQACQAFAARNMGWFYWGFGPGPSGDFNLVDEKTDTVSPILCYLGSGPDASGGHLPMQYTSVSLRASVASANPPNVVVSGFVQPPCGPVNVTLEYSNDQGASYQEIARITSAPNGSFSYSWMVPSTVSLLIRADVDGVKSSPVSIEISSGSGIPGFPLESLFIGGALGILLVGLARKRRLHFPKGASSHIREES